MKRLGDYLTRRVLGYLVVAATAALLTLFASGKANAQTDPYANCNNNAAAGGRCPDRPSAQSGIASYTRAKATEFESAFGGSYKGCYWIYGTNEYKGSVVGATTSCPTSGSGPYNRTFDTQCSNGGTWNDATQTCFSSAECLAKNSEPGFANVGDITKTFTSTCAGGCDYRAVGGYTTVAFSGQTFTHGTFEFTGDACPLPPDSTPPAPKPDKPQECIAASDGQTFCVKNNGDHCFTTGRTGRQMCWSPGETGQKTDQDILQKRDPGITPIPPTPKTNDPLAKVGDTHLTTTTTNTTTITTNTTNYRTESGTDAGPTNEGEISDGTDDTTKDGSVSHDGTCDTQPAVSGGDPLLANIILQTWGTRCATIDANAVTSTGEIGDCRSPFSITGPADDANVKKLKAARAEICPGELADNPAGTDGTYGTGDTTGEESTLRAAMFGEVSTGAEGLDSSGLGYSRSCPQMPIVDVFGAQIDFNLPAMCDWMQLGGQLVLILASLACLRVIAGGGAV